MKLVASMTTRNELDRYLRRVIPHLLAFCDEVRVVDDGSDDGTYEWLCEQDRVEVALNDGASWREHEGKLRQTLFEHTLEAEPEAVLAIDADELVTDGAAMRAMIEAQPQTRTFCLRMVEVWRRDRDPWLTREDGGWRAHDVGIVYRVPRNPQGAAWRSWPQRMAAGRVPRLMHIDQRRGNARSLGLDILHLGWSDPAEREARHRRYVELDGGQFHAGAHLDSIMWPDERCELEPYDRPTAWF